MSGNSASTPPAGGNQLTVRQDDFENYFPLIKERLNDHDATTPFTIRCPICTDTLWHSQTSSQNAAASAAMLAPCGHVFCRDCLTRCSERARAEDRPQCCPQCRHNFECVTCGDEVTHRALDLSEPPRIWLNEEHSRTLPEGGYQHAVCALCLIHAEFRYEIGCRPRGAPPRSQVIQGELEDQLEGALKSVLVVAAQVADSRGQATMRVADLTGIILTVLRDLELEEVAAASTRRTVVTRWERDWMAMGLGRRYF